MTEQHFINVQKSILVDALARNINDNFINVSFDLLKNRHIHIRIILEKCTESEEEYLEDISGEFEASQEADILDKYEIIQDKSIKPLRHVVYNRK